MPPYQILETEIQHRRAIATAIVGNRNCDVLCCAAVGGESDRLGGVVVDACHVSGREGHIHRGSLRSAEIGDVHLHIVGTDTFAHRGAGDVETYASADVIIVDRKRMFIHPTHERSALTTSYAVDGEHHVLVAIAQAVVIQTHRHTARVLITGHLHQGGETRDTAHRTCSADVDIRCIGNRWTFVRDVDIQRGGPSVLCDGTTR